MTARRNPHDSPPRDPAFTPGRRVALLLLVALLLGALPAAARLAEGDRVEITGVVTDAQGVGLADVQVVLEASRRAFSVRDLGRVEVDVQRQAVKTNARGEYALTWTWSRYYNHFELVVGVPVRRAGQVETQELARVDITRRIRVSPVVVAVTVADTRFLRAQREFLATVDSDDERGVYEQMGQPEKVETVRHPGHEVVTWWYFTAGKSYRFVAGRLEQVTPFEPVQPFAEAAP